MENTDRSLIEAHRKGDSAAFGEIVRRYGDSVLGYLIKMSENREKAEDLFQETFKRVHEKSGTYNGGDFKSWLFRIATNVSIDSLRKRKRIMTSKVEFDCENQRELLRTAASANDCQDNPSVAVMQAEQTQQVREAIKSLPDQQRTTLVLAYYQQLSYRQVAEVMNCSVGSVKTQMYRALRTLADKLPEVVL